MISPNRTRSKKEFLENDRKRKWAVEAAFEKFIWSSRFLVLFAVVASLAAALVLFLIGTFDIVRVVIEMVEYYLGTAEHPDIHAEFVGRIIGSVDVFLIAVVLLIFSFGLYELFVSHIDSADSTEASNILEIGSLDILKDKIGQVIIMALIVKFFQVVLGMKFDGIDQMLVFAGSVALLALSLFLLQLGKYLGHRNPDN